MGVHIGATWKVRFKLGLATRPVPNTLGSFVIIIITVVTAAAIYVVVNDGKQVGVVVSRPCLDYVYMG